ncbi:VWA domain-containing protein [uncultured Litoreibacter sp.]|uniref:vWA domain-containing protein n=1 Tax=uncultured Litoreibacter sp. TaxID=1392394 RepID=UPI0026277715|nr:VWA domain-containing protein [uncultured Litoreibacter sp.]
MLTRIFMALGLSALPFTPATATSSCAADAMLVFDGSVSMAEISFDIQDATRIVDARVAIRRAMPDVEKFRRIGLITYGPGDSACSGINLRFPPISNAADRVIAEVDAMVPEGLTPLAASVERAAEVLDYRTNPAIVVLVTDGNETCGGTPCALATSMMGQAADLTVHVIGFKVVRDFFSWDNPEQKDYFEGDTVAKCLSDRTGGKFVSTETVDELTEALRETLGCALIG